MHMLDTWEQTAVFNPADPTQKKIEKYAGIPGAYASYYFNRVPTTGTLKGPFSTGMATGAGVLVGIVLASAGIGLAVGAFNKVRGKPMHGLGWFRYRKRRRR